MKKHTGFSLVELMVVIAIVAILATVAVPLYSNYVQNNNRRDATSALMAASLAEDNFFIRNDEYSSDLSAIYRTTTDGNFYTLSVSLPNLEADPPENYDYRLTAIAIGSQQSDTECATISLEVDGAIQRKTPTACWDTY
ncbi:type IV pilin protein [Pseudofrancisella aestuarii]|uniref:Type IV pilin protein n=1 Tax=Pseudofrancisella aestuarii TaxID=2670347 RepID=A0ABV9TBK0_9GAMM|nr:type IV pilin protein [Pseudofrancisella aestuarii]